MEDLARSRDICPRCERVIDMPADGTRSGHLCAGASIREAYPDLGEEPFYGPGDYTPLVRTLCDEIIVEVSDSYYSGDTRYLLRDRAGRFGLLIISWGSCSGCDSLQACSSYAELEELRDSLTVEWFDTAGACAERLRSRDWQAHSSYRERETADFVEKSLAALGVA